jgi:hypothetical protein
MTRHRFRCRVYAHADALWSVRVQRKYPPHCLTELIQRAHRPLHDISRKAFGLLTADFANRPLSEVRCLFVKSLNQPARMGNNRKGNRK